MTTRKNIRNSNFTGQVGEFNTTYNSLVRMFGKTKADELKLNKELYKNLNFFINGEANSSDKNGKDVRHPKVKVPAYYGMTEEMKEKLSQQRKSYVNAYKSEWLQNKINEFLKENNPKENSPILPPIKKSVLRELFFSKPVDNIKISKSTTTTMASDLEEKKLGLVALAKKLGLEVVREKRYSPGPKPLTNSKASLIINLLQRHAGGKGLTKEEIGTAVNCGVDEVRSTISILRNKRGLEIIDTTFVNPETGFNKKRYKFANNLPEYREWRLNNRKDSEGVKRGAPNYY